MGIAVNTSPSLAKCRKVNEIKTLHKGCIKCLSSTVLSVSLWVPQHQWNWTINRFFNKKILFNKCNFQKSSEGTWKCLGVHFFSPPLVYSIRRKSGLDKKKFVRLGGLFVFSNPICILQRTRGPNLNPQQPHFSGTSPSRENTLPLPPLLRLPQVHLCHPEQANWPEGP